MIKLGVIGSNYADICLFLSRAFNSLGKKTALIDNSYSKELCACVPGDVLGIDKVDYRNVTFMKNKDWRTMQTPYDVVICVAGDNDDISFLEGMDTVLLITDQNAYNYKIVENTVITGANWIKDSDINLIIKDYIKCKISDKYIKSCLLEQVAITNTYTVDLNERDKEIFFTAQYNNVFKFDQLSSDMKTLLISVLENVLGESIDAKSMIKSFKLAERGM